MSEHTPGPWSAVPSMPQEGFDGFWIVPGHQSSLDRSVATVHGYQSNAEAQANARLIAAAPDLLAVCQQVLGGLDLEWSPKIVDINFPLLRATIAKVIGDPR